MKVNSKLNRHNLFYRKPKHWMHRMCSRGNNQACLQLVAAVLPLASGRRSPQIDFQRALPLGHISRPASGSVIFDQTAKNINQWTAPPSVVALRSRTQPRTVITYLGVPRRRASPISVLKIPISIVSNKEDQSFESCTTECDWCVHNFPNVRSEIASEKCTQSYKNLLHAGFHLLGDALSLEVIWQL